MASIIKIKRNSTQGAAPSSLEVGEIAVNLFDRKLFVGNTTGVTAIGGEDFRLTVDEGTTSGDGAYLKLLGENVLSTNSVLLQAGEGLDVTLQGNGSILFAGEDASDSNKGVASFNATHFSVSTGAVSAADITLSGDSGSAAATLGETFTISGTSGEISTSATGTTVTIGLPDDVTVAGQLNVSENIVVSGNTEVGNLLNVTGATTLSSTLDVTGQVNLNDTTTSTSTTTGALIVDGGVGVAENLNVGGDLRVTGDTTIDGNLVVEGALTYISTSTVYADDGMFKLAANNVGDTVDTGIYAKYVITANSAVKYAGYYRDATDGVFKFYEDLDTEPTQTVSATDNNYNLAQVDAIIDGGTY